MKIIIFGGDGFCGWPTSLHLASIGWDVLIIDNLSRRDLDKKLEVSSLTPIANIHERINTASQLIGNISFEEADIAKEPQKLRSIIKKFQPNGVVQFAEQRAAPFSMIDDESRRYTVDNNICGTHNICSALIDESPSTHLIHLGTMGVYGYSKDFGAIPEGYLNVKINQTQNDVDILYPANPGSIYHMTKCLDQLIFQFYSKNWGLKITDLHQGIVWGVNTEQTIKHENLINRFDYDGIYGTVLNRFLSQAANSFPLTVYGSGGQSRAFINISDTARCIELALKNHNFESNKPRIFNQVSEVLSVIDLAKLISKQFDVDYQLIDNPRKELAENELEVSNAGLISLGFDPIKLSEGLASDVKTLAEHLKGNFDASKVCNSPKW